MVDKKETTKHRQATPNKSLQTDNEPTITDNGLSIVDDVNLSKNEQLDVLDFNAYDAKTKITKIGHNQILERYINQVSTFPMLSKEEEERLLSLYLDNGDQQAGQAIVLSHLRLVVKIAMQYKNFGINMMDMIAEGNMGLMIALQRFDRSKKARFATYAGLWAKAKIQEFILKSWNMIKIGSTALRKQLLFNFSGLKKILHIDENMPMIEQNKRIANHFGITVNEYEHAVSSIKGREASLDAPIADDSNMSLLDTIDGTDGNFATKIALQEENAYRNKLFRESFSLLDERQKNILIARYLTEPKATLEELSIKYNISKERVRQIEESAIKKLKKFAEDHKL